MWRFIITILFTAMLGFSSLVNSAEEGSEETENAAEEEVKEEIMYYQIAPNIMTFYQNTGRKMGYIVVQVQLVVRGQDNWDLIDDHLPLVQDSLVDFFNSQDKDTVQDLQQREALRNQAKERVANVIKQEVGKNVIENLLFTQYVFQ